MDINKLANATVIAVFLFTGVALISCNRTSIELLAVKQLSVYPSGSALAYYNNHLFLMGDNARQMLVLDTAFQVTDSVSFVEGAAAFIEKSIKPDLEAMTLVNDSQQVKLLIVGSGAVVPYREKCFIVSPMDTDTPLQFDLHLFYSMLKTIGIKELNIEGAATVNNYIILANRGNKANPENHLIIAAKDFYKTTVTANPRLLLINIPAHDGNFAGISGLDYAPLSKQLFLTVSTENTTDSYSDGAIGKSYLMIINDFDERMDEKYLSPDKIIDLGEVDEVFNGHKIESVAIIKEHEKFIELVLVADDDKSDSWLFKLKVFR